MGRLQGRVAVITGAGDGIGEAIARRFALEGTKLIVAEISESRDRIVTDELAAAYGGNAAFIRTDVRRKGDNVAMINTAVDLFGSIDILVNNSWGGGKLRRVELKTDALIDHGLAIGFRGPLWAMQAAFPHLKAKGWGRIINMCSLNGVACNVICPAAKSASFRHVMAEHPELVASVDAANPMGRIGDSYDDISPVALFLASEDCRDLTRNTLFVDGGSHTNGSSWALDLTDEP